jgi:hypothetical protein
MKHIQLLPQYPAQGTSSILFASRTSPVPPFAPFHAPRLLRSTRLPLALDLRIGLYAVGVLHIQELFGHSLTATFFVTLHFSPLPPVKDKTVVATK